MVAPNGNQDEYYAYKAKKYEAKYNALLARMQNEQTEAQVGSGDQLSAEDAFYKAKFEKYQRKYERLLQSRK